MLGICIHAWLPWKTSLFCEVYLTTSVVIPGVVYNPMIFMANWNLLHAYVWVMTSFLRPCMQDLMLKPSPDQPKRSHPKLSEQQLQFTYVTWPVTRATSELHLPSTSLHTSPAALGNRAFYELDFSLFIEVSHQLCIQRQSWSASCLLTSYGNRDSDPSSRPC